MRLAPCSRLLSGLPWHTDSGHCGSGGLQGRAMAKLVKCRGCGQMVSKRAKLCPSCGEPAKRRTSCLGLLGLVLIVFVLAGVLSQNGRIRRDGAVPDQPHAQTKPPETKSSPNEGIAILDVPGAQYVWLAVGDADWDDFLDAENEAAKGGDGSTVLLKKMVAAGRAFLCNNKTRVRVLKSSFTARFVVILEGEFADSTGWVQSEFVKAIE